MAYWGGACPGLSRTGAAGGVARGVLGVKLASQAMRRLRRFPQESLAPARASGEEAKAK